MLNPQTVRRTFGRPADHWMLILIDTDGSRLGTECFDDFDEAKQALADRRAWAPSSTLSAVFDETEVAS